MATIATAASVPVAVPAERAPLRPFYDYGYEPIIPGPAPSPPPTLVRVEPPPTAERFVAIAIPAGWPTAGRDMKGGFVQGEDHRRYNCRSA